MARVMNHNAADFLWDDSVGAGLQQALFDAVGKAMGVPVHRLLGHKIRDRAFISWWAIDMPGADWVLECKDAAAEGYTFFKTKARPWFDLLDQCEKLMPTLPRLSESELRFQRHADGCRRGGPVLYGSREVSQRGNVRVAPAARRRGRQPAVAQTYASGDRHALRLAAADDRAEGRCLRRVRDRRRYQPGKGGCRRGGHGRTSRSSWSWWAPGSRRCSPCISPAC